MTDSARSSSSTSKYSSPPVKLQTVPKLVVVMENRITIEDLKQRYRVSERTLRTWKETKGLPLREISPQNKWVYENDLKEWENKFI